MPFGCLTLGEKKDYNSPSEVTDKYDLGQVVKSEEFCEIFRAKDKNTLKMYTCKKFLKKDGRKVRKAAKNEILILKMVKHHNILQLVDVFETRKEYFLFLELATGREVFDWILDQGYYSERDTSNVIRQVLEAVAYLHSLHIVHRNLKLENLVYYNRLKNSKIVISDFHLAKLENGLIKEPCGTPEYLAPEVVGRQRYGRPVDCWAIGVIMYILLSGNPPFYDETEDDDYDNHDKNLFRKILSGDYEFDSPYWDDISDSAKSLVACLMEVEQDQRVTAQEAINHEWISGNAASDKNIKDGVCAQIEKNFAKAKWKTFVFSTLQRANDHLKKYSLKRLILEPLKKIIHLNTNKIKAAEYYVSAIKEWLDFDLKFHIDLYPNVGFIQKSPAAELQFISIFYVIIFANQQLKPLLYFIHVHVIMFLSILSIYYLVFLYC
uniref:CaM kinase-like vesicle-associated protein n=1 Tax=Cyprinus carpio TaxID=7962 RepID=A0A8C1VPB7_CYPCA